MTDAAALVCRARFLQPLADGSRSADIMARVQRLSEAFADHRAGAAKVRGTGAHQ